MSVEAPRASFLPTIKCSDCSLEVDLVALADHECTGPRTLADDVLLFSPALIPAPLQFGPKTGLDLSAPKPRPPAIDPKAANLPFFKNTSNGTPSSNHSSDSNRSDSNTNTSSSSNFLSVSNLTANTTPSSEEALSLKSPVRFFMPLLSPRNESPTDPNYVPVSPITDNSNILRRMNTIAPGPFSLTSPNPKRGAPKPLPQVPAPLIKEPEQKDLPAISNKPNAKGLGQATLQSRPSVKVASKPENKLSKTLPSVPDKENEQIERRPTARRGTNNSRDNIAFADGNSAVSERLNESPRGLPRPERDGAERSTEKPFASQQASLRNQSPPRIEQRSKTFPENDSGHARQPSSSSKKDLANRFNIPMGLPRRPSEPTAALKSLGRAATTPDLSSKNAPPPPAPLQAPAVNSRLANQLSYKNGKSLPQSPKPDQSFARPSRRAAEDTHRLGNSSREYDEINMPRGEPERGLGGPVKAKTWDSSPEKPSRSRNPQQPAAPEQLSPSKSKQSPICRHCRMPIEGERPVSSSDGKLSGKFHKKCFKCAHCKDPFYPSAALGQPSRKEQPSTFYIIDDQPYCAHDYHVRNNSLCPACGLGIEGDCFEIDFDTDQPKRFHISGCFACAVPGCREGFENGYYEGGLGQKRYYCVKHAPSKKATRRYTRLMPLI